MKPSPPEALLQVPNQKELLFAPAGFGFFVDGVLKTKIEVFPQFLGIGEKRTGHGCPIFHHFAVSKRMGGVEFLEERLQLLRRQPQRQRSVPGEKTEHGPVGGSVRDCRAFALNVGIGGDKFFIQRQRCRRNGAL
jgi:hypothetical protein